jgi:hypothetical protein
VSRVTENKAPRGWWICFLTAFSFTGVLGLAIGYLLWMGIGVWGNNSPVGWAWDITNFVWWIGIGHAGTLISAVLFLFRQKWRTSINRFAEAMTIFAVICALMFPGIHVGRIWHATTCCRSPTRWDLAELQEPAALGRVRGQHLLHGLAALLVRRPHPRPRDPARPREEHACAAMRVRLPRPRLARLEPSLAELRARVPDPRGALDAARALGALGRVLRLRHLGQPGWHTTIFPPYFVAGAVFSGFAMVMTLMLITAPVFGCQPRHDPAPRADEQDHARDGLRSSATRTRWSSSSRGTRATPTSATSSSSTARFGPYAWAYWSMISCNVLSPQLFWFKKLRTSIP